MAWGILEDTSSGLGHVPGTALLEEDFTGEEGSAAHHSHEHLKKTVVRGETIILVPQPSDDANDPLGWPLWTRDLLFLLYAYCGLLCIGGIGPILSSLTLDLVARFGISFTDVSLLTGYSLCATGASGLFISAVTHKYGKRIPLLFSMAAAFAGTLWGGAATSHHSLLGARIVQGFSVSMFESVFFAVVGDLYFVHERGVRVALVTTCISGLSNLPPVLAGKIATDLGWRWVFWLLSIFLGVGLGLSVLLGWETAYNRNPVYDTDVASTDKKLEDMEKLEKRTTTATSTSIAAAAARPRQSFAARLHPYSGTYTHKPLWRLAIDPVLILANPAVIWAVLLMSFPTLWVIGINLLIAQIFSGPPFQLTTTQLGYMSAGPTVGGSLGSVFAGLMSDPLIKYMSRKNGGVYEPEFRLLLIVPAVVLSAIAYFLFGHFVIEPGVSPVAMATLWGLATASLQFVMMAVGTYCVDAYRASSVEIFISTMVIKNFLFFGFTYFLNDWVAQWGGRRMFYCIAGIQIGLCLTTIPLYVYGKQLRAWWHKPSSSSSHQDK
ncbi:major facilitator superfamily domain-containing protein [Apodospora peruviana]|uniref:Major facilitator superfamily domain-containing protein n=1 Tax=Apodospora peruviana TaxID=516989 RepID=A0AAE0HTQ3_9PEZI|nr:major facilitator superfamily domain-containing protein [Apodospora peruviana]